MKPADYKCENCGNIKEIWIEDTKNFPDFYQCLICGSAAKRIYSPLPAICHMGKVGNSANGYKSTGGNIKKTK